MNLRLPRSLAEELVNKLARASLIGIHNCVQEAEGACSLSVICFYRRTITFAFQSFESNHFAVNCALGQYQIPTGKNVHYAAFMRSRV